MEKQRPMVEVKDLCRRYGDFLAVDHLSFTIPRGRILGFLGPNGSGKTTTMRILSGFMPPSAGRVTIAGMDLQENGLAVKKIIGYLPETPPLYLSMRVDEYLGYVAGLKGVDPPRISERVQNVRQKCGLEEVCRRPLGTLSKGYRQRVGIAQSLINNPEFLILDEPTVGLDPRQISEIRALIKSLAGELTVVLSTHILPEVTLICDDILIIYQGRLRLHEPLTAFRGKDLERIFLGATSEEAAAALPV